MFSTPKALRNLTTMDPNATVREIRNGEPQEDEMIVIFTRTETGAAEHVAARNVTEQEAADLIAALLRFPHITAARTR